MPPVAPNGAVFRPEFYRAPRTTSTRDGFEAVAAATVTIVLYGIFGAIVKSAPIARNITVGTTTTIKLTRIQHNRLISLEFRSGDTARGVLPEAFGTGCAICSDCTEETSRDGSADSHADFGPLTSEAR